MICSLSGLARELFIILFLNTRHEVIKKELHTIGSAAGTPVYPAELCRSALLCGGCRAVILIHNHLTVNIEPSVEDKDITVRIKKGLELFDLELTDHIILAGDGNSYFSFKDRGLL